MELSKIKDVAAYLESLAPRQFQETYDNSGLLTGDPEDAVRGVLVTLDCTEQVVQEAISTGCNLIVAHHPIIFKGLKKLTGQNYVERTVISAIRNRIAIFAIHTNLDNIYAGVNKKIAERLGLKNIRVLAPKSGLLSKLVTFVPSSHLGDVLTALYSSGAGQIGNYKDCSFQVPGTGTYTPGAETQPFAGKRGESEQTEEIRVEVLIQTHESEKILSALRKAHPYEEVAYYLTKLDNENPEVGSGMIGELNEAEEPTFFLGRLKALMNTPLIRHTAVLPTKIRKVAVCGGAGSFLLGQAIAQGADLYVSADFKYHEFFDSEGKIIIADIGHYESEQFTKELLIELLTKKFTTFAINFSKTVTNPLSYL